MTVAYYQTAASLVSSCSSLQKKTMKDKHSRNSRTCRSSVKTERKAEAEEEHMHSNPRKTSTNLIT